MSANVFAALISVFGARTEANNTPGDQGEFSMPYWVVAEFLEPDLALMDGKWHRGSSPCCWLCRWSPLSAPSIAAELGSCAMGLRRLACPGYGQRLRKAPGTPGALVGTGLGRGRAG